MGITKQALKAIIAENAFRPIHGDWVSFGRQTVNVSADELGDICGGQLPSTLESDRLTRHSNADAISDRSLFEALFPVRYVAIDRSSYEGADVICDLTEEVSDRLWGSADFVFTGGCLDNVFRPSEMLINSSRLLRPGGRVLHFESAGGLLGAYTSQSAEWFYSYYAANAFADCRVYLLHQRLRGRSRFDYAVDVYSYKPSFSRKPDLDYFECGKSQPGVHYILVVAEKGAESTVDIIPNQLQYLEAGDVQWPHMETVFQQSGRPSIEGPDAIPDLPLPFLSDHYVYRGSNF